MLAGHPDAERSSHSLHLRVWRPGFGTSRVDEPGATAGISCPCALIVRSTTRITIRVVTQNYFGGKDPNLRLRLASKARARSLTSLGVQLG
jgi:hypothetical protein